MCLCGNILQSFCNTSD
uniref:Uncharacterized protein n=1 Tax=Anguilla anguilla TaxID=7936 RepID=A0A0E9VWY4_ANGAN